jgi:hypothetical protein
MATKSNAYWSKRQRKLKIIAFELLKTDFNKIKRAAKEANQTVSAYIREAISRRSAS